MLEWMKYLFDCCWNVNAKWEWEKERDTENEKERESVKHKCWKQIKRMKIGME